MPFPLAKLTSLGLRQVSKHIARFVKERARTNPTFRKSLIRGASWFHNLQTKTHLNILGLGERTLGGSVKPLTEQAAIDLGCEIINDIVIVTLFLGIFIFVESRPSKPAIDHSKFVKKEDMAKLEDVITQQKVLIERQSARIDRLERVLLKKEEKDRLVEKFKLELGKYHTVIDRQYEFDGDNLVILDVVGPPIDKR